MAADALVGLIPTATTLATATHAAAIHRARDFRGLLSSLSVINLSVVRSARASRGKEIVTIREVH